MKSLHEATEDDIREVLLSIAGGSLPSQVMSERFDASPKDLQVTLQSWMKQYKEDMPFGEEVATETILTKEGALRRLAVLALYSEQEETQRKAVMDIAKIQKWVDDSTTVLNTLMSGSMQDLEKYFTEHTDQLEQVLHQARSRGALQGKSEPH